MTWVGSADTEKYDQVLDSVLVGPVVPGQYRFVFQVGPSCQCCLCSTAPCLDSSVEALCASQAALRMYIACRQMRLMEASFRSRT